MTSLHDLGPSPSNVYAKQEQERLVSGAMRKMPLDLQIALELHYWDKMSLSELAHVFELIAEEYREKGQPLPGDTTEIVNA